MAINGNYKDGFFLIQGDGQFRSEAVEKIKALVQGALDKGNNFIVFDMSQCQYVDSLFVSYVVNLYKKLKKKKGRIGILNPTSVVKEILSVSNLETIVTIYKTQEDLLS